MLATFDYDARRMFQAKQVPELREHTYELAYNAACQLVAQGKYAEAEKKLKVAEKLCREALQEEDEDIEEGLGIIRSDTP